MNHVLEAKKKVVNSLSQMERGAGKGQQLGTGCSLQQCTSSSKGGTTLMVPLFIHLFIPLALFLEFIFLLILWEPACQPSQPSQPSNEHLFSFSCAPMILYALEGLDQDLARVASAGPAVFLESAGALPQVCLCRHEPGLCDSGQCPAGQG